MHATLARGHEGEAARAVIARLAEGGWSGITSSLVVDEVVWGVWKLAGRETGLEAGESMYRIPHLAVVGVSERVPQRALTMMRKLPLRPRDAFHAATMLEEGVSSIVSADADFDRVRELRRIDPATAARRR